MINPFSAAYAQIVTEGIFKSFSHHKEPRHRMAHNTAGEERRHGGQKTDRGGGQ